MSRLTALLFVILLIVVQVLWIGYIVSLMWSWFVVPLFNSPALPLLYAIGLITIIQLILHGKEEIPARDFEEINWNSMVFDIILHPASFLCVGWIIHLLINIKG